MVFVETPARWAACATVRWTRDVSVSVAMSAAYLPARVGQSYGPGTGLQSSRSVQRLQQRSPELGVTFDCGDQRVHVL
jgi:hypothetical protein